MAFSIGLSACSQLKSACGKWLVSAEIGNSKIGNETTGKVVCSKYYFGVVSDPELISGL